jgi:hypothetical protein
MRNRIIMLTLLLTSLTMSVTAGKNSYMGKVQSVVSDVEKDSTMSDAEFAKRKQRWTLWTKTTTNTAKT